MGKSRKTTRKSITADRLCLFLMLGGLLLLAGTAVFLNIGRYTVCMDSDIAAEGLNARAIWEHHSLIPEEFYHSTETRILNVNLIGALLYGLTGNMNLSMGIACSVMLVLLLAFYGMLLRKMKYGWSSALAALVLLLALSGNLRHAQILYLWAAYYAIHCVLMLASLMVWLDAIHEENGWKWKMAAAALFALVISLSGLRAALIVYAPLFCLELVRWIRSLWLCKRVDRSHLRSGLCAFLFLFCSYLGSLFPTSVGVAASRNIRNGLSKLWETVLPDAWQCLATGEENAVRLAFLCLLLLLTVLAVLEVVKDVYKFERPADAGLSNSSIGAEAPAAAFGKTAFADFASARYKDGKSCQGKNSDRKENGGNQNHGEPCVNGEACKREESFEAEADRRRILLFFLASWVISILMGAFTTTESVWRYYFMSYFLISYGVSYVAEELQGRGKGLLKTGILLVVFLSGLLMWQQEILPELQSSPSGNSDYEQITSWMQEQGYSYGYSTYDSANAMTGSCNGAVQISAVSDLGTLEICKWLTDKSWYVPALPVDMDTVYIVPKAKQEEFQRQLELHEDLREAMETEQYLIYVAPHNYTSS